MTPAVAATALSKSYRVGRSLFSSSLGKTVTALSDVNLEIAPGEIFGVVGRNGYGKTTLTKCLASLLLPSAGTTKVFGLDGRSQGRELRRVVGWVGTEERSFYFRLTGLQNLQFFAELQGLDRATFQARVARFSEMVGVEGLLARRFYEYSTGNRHKLAIVRALLHDPKLLILDEPTRSLDPFAAETLRRSLKTWVAESEQRTIVITSHNLSEVESLCTRIAIMRRGTLGGVGSLGELRARFGQPETIRIRTDQEPSGLGPDETFETDAKGEGWLNFEHQPGDDRLPGALTRLLAQRVPVLSVERRQLGLQEIIDRMDGEEDA